jgi:hypothetical protein
MAKANVTKLQAVEQTEPSEDDLRAVAYVLGEVHGIFRALHHLFADFTDPPDPEIAMIVVSQLSIRGCLMIDACLRKMKQGEQGNFRDEFGMHDGREGVGNQQ